MSVGELRASIADVPDDYEVVLDNAEVDDCEISAVRVVAERYAGKALEHHARTEAAEAALAGLVAAVEALADQHERVMGARLPMTDREERESGRRTVRRLRALIDADHAAALRAHEALAWDDAVTEGFDGGWLHDAARDELLARNPYRADSIEQARP